MLSHQDVTTIGSWSLNNKDGIHQSFPETLPIRKFANQDIWEKQDNFKNKSILRTRVRFSNAILLFNYNFANQKVCLSKSIFLLSTLVTILLFSYLSVETLLLYFSGKSDMLALGLTRFLPK